MRSARLSYLVLIIVATLLAFFLIKNSTKQRDEFPGRESEVSGELAGAHLSRSMADEKLIEDAVARALRSGETSFAPWKTLASASKDAVAAEKIGSFGSFCSAVLPNEYTGVRPERFDGSEWQPWVAQCNRELWLAISEARQNFAHDDPPELLQMRMIDNDDAEGASRRDILALRIIHNSNNPMHVAYGALEYFHDQRIKEWSNVDGGQPAPIFVIPDTDKFRIDLSLFLACRVGRNCAGDTWATLSECAVTAYCHPGMNMEQIIAMRRSPAEMRLIADFTNRVLSGRRK